MSANKIIVIKKKLNTKPWFGDNSKKLQNERDVLEKIKQMIIR